MFKIHRTFDLSTGTKSKTISVVNTPYGLFVVYHKTVVFEIVKKTITLRNGGWDTVSTRLVIDQCFRQMGIRIHLIRRKNQTFVVNLDNVTTTLFVDGMKIKI